jgi:hypothetical protein
MVVSIKTTVFLNTTSVLWYIGAKILEKPASFFLVLL